MSSRLVDVDVWSRFLRRRRLDHAHDQPCLESAGFRPLEQVAPCTLSLRMVVPVAGHRWLLPLFVGWFPTGVFPGPPLLLATPLVQ